MTGVKAVLQRSQFANCCY